MSRDLRWAKRWLPLWVVCLAYGMGIAALHVPDWESLALLGGAVVLIVVTAVTMSAEDRS
jgi:hypothetical protein